MTRSEYAKITNWQGKATRIINTNDLPDFQIGEIVNPGLCWTNGGEFRIESEGRYTILFDIIESVEGHQVDYDNEAECTDLSCEDCFGEKEIIIDKDFIIVDFWEWDEETQLATVFLKALDNKA